MSGTTPRTGERPVSMAELLAAARSASAVSTPPAEPAVAGKAPAEDAPETPEPAPAVAPRTAA
ncbi:hypothetical protein [Streptacidiphilus cavernicola]|uniref:Uncharacterized protein n=1 Tax=Streptacidiphilus cavernicola TaxID=3342716 RepID=A0ABV6VTP5_9ACTN